MYVPDNLDAYNEYSSRQESRLDARPKCEECGNPIQDEGCYYINGELICNECMEGYKVNTEDYLEG